MYLTAEELLTGKGATYEIEIPPDILQPGLDNKAPASRNVRKVKLRPLTVRDVQLIVKAAKEDEVLTSVLMISKSMLEPELKQSQIAEMHSGLVRYLVDCINKISGLTTSQEQMQQIAESPLVQAFFILAREFHWTPEQVKQLTVGQILSYLEHLNKTKKVS